MGKVKIIFLDAFIENVAAISFFIESKGLPKTAIKYKNAIYDFIENIEFDKIDFQICRDPERAFQNLKCIPFNKKYTIVFCQFSDEVLITEFIVTKMIHW